MQRQVAPQPLCRTSWSACISALGLVVAALSCACCLAQVPQDRPASLPLNLPLAPPRNSPESGPPAGSGQLVVDVIIEGDHTTKDYEIQKHIHTRKDREFDPEILQGDVRRLHTSGLFRQVTPYTEQVPGGVIVRFKVVERPRIHEIKFLGNRNGPSEKKLLKEIGVKKNDPLNSYSAEESRRKVEDLYRSSGFPAQAVTIFEGDKPGDKDLIFVINEGPLERISSVTFEGNAISSDAVLRTKIQSKPGYFWYLFGGKVDRTKIDADVQTLTAYYRALGYFRARVSRTLDYDDDGEWLKLTFIIDEGPRYQVRSVAVEGGTKFATDPLLQFLQLKSGEYFNQGEANKDVSTLVDLYGSQGHVFADVQPDLRFLDEPGQLDVVYRIKEGDVFSVKEINVHIAGEFPHTKQTVVLSRLSVRPGDVIDSRELRNSERRLKASTIFAGAQNDGEPPRIVVRPPDLNSIGGDSDAPPRRPTVRGQEPDTNRPLPSQNQPPASSPVPAPQPPCIYSWNGPAGPAAPAVPITQFPSGPRPAMTYLR